MPPARPDLPPSLASGPFRLADAAEAGVSPSKLRNRSVQRLHTGVYLGTDVDVDFATRCRAALLALPDGSMLSHHSAAELGGLPVPKVLQIHAVVPVCWLPRHPGIVTHRVADLPHALVRGLPATLAARTWLDLAAALDRLDLIVLGDAILRRGLTLGELTTACAAARGRRGMRAARAALGFLEPRVDSPMETRLRMLLVDAGLPRPLVNVPVRDEGGQLLCTPDLHYPTPRVAIQYEGDHHRTDKEQWRNDIARDDVMREVGWEVLRFVDVDVYQRPDRTVDRVRRALARVQR